MGKNDSTEDEPYNFPKFFGAKNSEKQNEDKIFEFLKKIKEEGMVGNEKISMIENILKLDIIAVDEIMTHRIDLKAVEKDSSFEEVLNLFIKTKHKRLLVYEKDIDKIVGFININTILKNYIEKNDKKEKIDKYIQKAIFVPETMKCLNLLENLKKEKEEFAIVVDEYGGTSGIVSLFDLRNFVFKSLYETTKKTNFNMIKLDDSTILLKGTANLKEVGDYLNISIKENENFDTIGGFLVDFLGKIPEENEHPTIEYEGVKFKVLSVDKQHIDKVQVLR